MIVENNNLRKQKLADLAVTSDPAFMLKWFLMLLLGFGCKHEVQEPVIVDMNMENCLMIGSYNGGVNMIIQNNCALSGCHVASGFKDFSNYAELKKNIENYGTENIILRFSNGGGMPPDYTTGPKMLSYCEQQQLKVWLRSGYPEN